MKKLVLSIIKLKEKYPNRPILIAITGKARSGKTTFSINLSNEFTKRNFHNIIYHGDWNLIKTSEERKRWIYKAFYNDVGKYIWEINTLNWWDLDTIKNNLKKLLLNKTLIIKSFYSVQTRVLEKRKIALLPKNGIIIYENAILGSDEQLALFDKILFLSTPEIQCLKDSLKADDAYRNIFEIVSRFILTTYGENIFFNKLFSHYKSKITYINRNGEKTQKPIFQECNFFPIPIQKIVPSE